ncbi:MAG: ABC transporter ATP-binding protein [Pseudomonadota bacterium]
MSLTIRQLSVPIAGCHIVTDASLSIAPGKLVGLIGANGAGKTTLLRASAGLIPGKTGNVLIDGISADTLSPRQRAKQMAYLPQGQAIDWALSVRDVVALGRFPFQGRFGRQTGTDITAINATLDRLGLTGLADRQATTLSGGERALVLLARALTVGAPYLLADEPTAALDPARQLQVMALLKSEAVSGKGVLVVLHDLNLAARYLDQVVVMEKGQVIADGPPSEVLTAETLQRAYGITPLTGEENGERWLIPWERTPSRD